MRNIFDEAILIQNAVNVTAVGNIFQELAEQALPPFGYFAVRLIEMRLRDLQKNFATYTLEEWKKAYEICEKQSAEWTLGGDGFAHRKEALKEEDVLRAMSKAGVEIMIDNGEWEPVEDYWVIANRPITGTMLGASEEQQHVVIPEGTRGVIVDLWPNQKEEMLLQVEWYLHPFENEEDDGTEEWAVKPEWVTPFEYNVGQRVTAQVDLFLRDDSDSHNVHIERGDQGFVETENGDDVSVRWDKAVSNDCSFDEIAPVVIPVPRPGTFVEIDERIHFKCLVTNMQIYGVFKVESVDDAGEYVTILDETGDPYLAPLHVLLPTKERFDA